MYTLLVNSSLFFYEFSKTEVKLVMKAERKEFKD